MIDIERKWAGRLSARPFVLVWLYKVCAFVCSKRNAQRCRPQKADSLDSDLNYLPFLLVVEVGLHIYFKEMYA